MIGQRLIVQSALPMLAAALLPWGVSKYATVPSPFTKQDQDMFLFSPMQISISQPVMQAAQDMVCPVRGASAKPDSMQNPYANYPPVPLRALAPAYDAGLEGGSGNSPFRLSLVLVNDESRLAIIDRRVIREGDFYRGYQVKNIRTNGVRLSNNQGELWVPIE